MARACGNLPGDHDLNFPSMSREIIHQGCMSDWTFVMNLTKSALSVAYDPVQTEAGDRGAYW